MRCFEVMNLFNKTRILVLALLLAAALAQLPFNYAAAAVNRLPLADTTALGNDPGILVLPSVTLSPTPMASATNATWYLHDANTTVNGTVYATINSSVPNGTLAHMTAATTPIGVRVVSNTTNNISIFASPPVPAGFIWIVSGNWTYNLVTRPSAASTGAGYLYTRLYRIDTGGNLTWVDTANSSTDVLGGNVTHSLVGSNDTVAMFTLRAGERFGVEFLLKVTTLQTGTLLLGYDNITSSNSSVSVTYTETAVPAGGLIQDNYRIGNNRLLSAMTWKNDIDTPAINIPRNKNFRVRFQVENPASANKSWRPQLEWSTTSGSGYAAVPVTSGSAPFFVALTDNFTNGAAINAPSWFGTGIMTGSVWNGTAYDTENPASASITLPGGNCTEIEFNVRANDNAAYNTTYYFRLTNAGTAFNAYDVTDAVVTIQLQPGASDPHNLYVSTTDKCAACHRPHIGQGPYLRKMGTSEQTLCLSCHDGTGAGTNINLEFNKTWTGNVSHNLSQANWVHSPYENASTSFNGTNRHVECEDCHQQHGQYPRTLNIGNNALSPNQYATWGIGVNNTAANTSPTYFYRSEASYEFETCFKCHSSWSYGAGPPLTPGGTVNSTNNATNRASQTNIAIEFNTLNYSHHAVEGKGNNQPPLTVNPNWIAGNWGLGLGNTFVSPWNTQSTVKCSDCHGSNNTTAPNGPHGSTLRWMVKPYTGNASVSSTAIFCYNCHNREVYGDINDVAFGTDNVTFKDTWTRFPHRWWLNQNGNHLDNNANNWGIFCRNCHGGDKLGGIHGTNRGVGTSGTTMVGKRFLNGAGVAGWTVGNTTTDSGVFYAKASNDEVTNCSRHSTGQTWTAQYNFYP